MVKLRDHYFIAWLKVVKNKDFSVDPALNIYVDITSDELKVFSEEYKSTLKPLLQEIRNTVKHLNNLITNELPLNLWGNKLKF